MKAKIGLALLALWGIGNISYAAVDNEAVKVKWGYKGEVSPAHWASLSSDFELCATGKQQSPINIKTKNIPLSETTLKLNYKPSMLTELKNGTTLLQIGKRSLLVAEGHGLQLDVPKDQQSNETLLLNNKQYQLLQFHFHTPSETQLNNESAPAEIHFVNQGKNGEVAVIAVFIQVGAANPVLETIINHAPQTEGRELAIDEVVDYTKLISTKQGAYQFMGSLTTPPCTEGLKWLVLVDPITASAEQVAKLRQAEGANARPIQSLNKRPITLQKGAEK